jgi:hypothetical protein
MRFWLGTNPVVTGLVDKVGLVAKPIGHVHNERRMVSRHTGFLQSCCMDLSKGCASAAA